MLGYLGFGSTLIIYGVLSESPAGGIKVIPFIGKAQTIESFLLSTYMARKGAAMGEIAAKAEALYQKELKTEVSRSFGFHEIKEAIEYYGKN